MGQKLTPRNDRVVVRPKPEETTTAGGIMLAPASNKDKPQQGVVVAVGPGKKLDDGSVVAVDLKEGDTVVYAKYSGTDFKLDGEDMLVLREDDIIAIIQ